MGTGGRTRERKRGVNIGVATLKKIIRDIKKSGKINCVKIKSKQRNAAS